MGDAINHPPHYAGVVVEPIDVCERYSFCMGCALKYIFRAGLKEGASEIIDLRKAVWYLKRQREEMTPGSILSPKNTAAAEAEILKAQITLLIKNYQDKNLPQWGILRSLFTNEDNRAIGLISGEKIDKIIERLEDRIKEIE